MVTLDAGREGSILGGMLLTRDHWLERASHARTQAKFIRDPEGRRLLLEVADLYDKIAERARLVGNEIPYERGGDAEGS